MTLLQKGGLRARLAQGADDLHRAQSLRGLCFHGGGLDADAHDAICDHVLIEDGQGRLLCCFRFLSLASGAEIDRSYSAQFYDLSKLARFSGPMVELGRFCIHPNEHHPDILRMAWGALTAYVDTHAVELLFGCTSFAGTDAAPYQQPFALLGALHLAPAHWRPGILAPEVVPLAGLGLPDDPRMALAIMPPLLRTYLTMGGWVSDHAVVDRQMNTLHVFTGVEIALISDTRKRLLRAVVQ